MPMSMRMTIIITKAHTLTSTLTHMSQVCRNTRMNTLIMKSERLQSSGRSSK